MDKKLSRLIEPGFSLYFIVFLLFACVSTMFNIGLAIFELVICAILYVFYLNKTSKKKKEIIKYLESVAGNVDSANKQSITNFPMPVAVASVTTGEIVWCNNMFSEAVDSEEHLFETKITDIITGFDTKWLLEGKHVYPTSVKIGSRFFSVMGNLVRSAAGDTTVLMTLYLSECTDYVELKKDSFDKRPVVAVVSIDNYEELLKNATDSEKSTLLAEIDKKTSEWISNINGLWRKYDRDKYVFVLENRDLDKLKEDKFSVLESVRSIQSLEGINATLSIGIGKDGDTLKEKHSFALLALEMALSRGGDQVVIKNKYAFEFFGGVSKEVEKRTKVKSRVMANALSQLIKDSSQVFIMGHTMSDIDSVGAAIGMVCAVRNKEKPAKIVIDKKRTLAKVLLDRVENVPEYEGVFITPEEAMLMSDSGTLLIVVDTNRPDFVESQALLQSVNKVAVIDHHRRAANYIENCAVNMHEPYASSASELVSELLQYMVPNRTIMRIEAECLLAGIYLDTKGFTIKAGVRTFEAAAYLKRAGADMVEVKKLFQNSFDGYMMKQGVITGAKTYGNGVVYAVSNQSVDRAIAAQAADELLNIIGVNASIIVFKNGNDTIVSARSMGKINVQLIVEKLGGGGNLTSAGAQLTGISPERAEIKVIQALDEYFEQNKEQE